MHHLQTPTVDSGLIELAVDDRRTTAIHQFVASARLSVQGNLYWVDAGNTASTYVFTREFDRRHRRGNLQIARAFTAYQHFALCRRLVREATPRVGMVVVPNVATLYQDDDVPDYEDSRLLESSLRVLREFSETYDVPVIISAPGCSPDHRNLVEEHTTRTIDCEQTEFGLRFEGVDFETTVYWDNGYWQTTISYWVDLLGIAGDDQAMPAAADIHVDGQTRTPVPDTPVQGV